MITTYRNGIAIVKPEGTLSDVKDSGEHEALEHVLASLIEGGTTRIIVDMSAITHLSATACGPLIAAHEALSKKKGGRFALTGLDDTIKHVLEVSKLRMVFETFETNDAAIDAFKDG